MGQQLRCATCATRVEHQLRSDALCRCATTHPIGVWGLSGALHRQEAAGRLLNRLAS
jgi:hypothetical protein